MRRHIIAAAAVAVAGGTGVALAEDPPKPVKAPVDRPTLVSPAPAALLPGGPFLPEPEPFGLHKEIADDMAKELGLPAERVAEAMKKAIGAQFDRRRDQALDCFDDRDKCKAAAALPPFIRGHTRPVPVRPGRSVRP
jgi:hypothetical protein